MYEGLSSETALPGGFDLIVHEIIGHLAGAEGVVRSIRELRTRPGCLAPGFIMVPRAAGTLLAPTSMLEHSQLCRIQTNYQDALQSHAAAQWPTRWASDGLPAAKMTSAQHSVVCASASCASPIAFQPTMFHVFGFPEENMLAEAAPFECDHKCSAKAVS